MTAGGVYSTKHLFSTMGSRDAMLVHVERRATRSRPLVVFVDEDSATRDAMAAALDACGFHVLTAECIADAVWLAKIRRPGVLVSTVHVLDIDGCSIDEFLTRHACSGPPLHFLFVTKPCDPEAIGAVLHRLLAGPMHERGAS